MPQTNNNFSSFSTFNKIMGDIFVSDLGQLWLQCKRENCHLHVFRTIAHSAHACTHIRMKEDTDRKRNEAEKMIHVVTSNTNVSLKYGDAVFFLTFVRFDTLLLLL